MPDATDSRSKPIEKWTLGILIAATIGGAAQFLFVTWPAARVEIARNSIAAARAQAESLSVTGSIRAPDLYVRIKDVPVAVCPVVIELSNDGERPIELKTVEFRVFVAPLHDISSIVTVAAPKDKLILASGQVTDATAQSDEDTYVGTISAESSKWIEKEQLRQKFEINTKLPAGQYRSQKMHLLASHNNPSVVTKVEVLIHTSNSTLRWHGFSNPAMCSPAAFASPGTDATNLAPAPAPPPG